MTVEDKVSYGKAGLNTLSNAKNSCHAKSDSLCNSDLW